MRIYFAVILFTIVFLNGNAQQLHYGEILFTYEKEHNFNGVAVVAKHGNLEYLGCTGVANRSDGTLMKTSTKFKIASVTKTFTAVIILQLMEEGKLLLEDKIAKHFPDYKGEGKDKVTILKLLTYSSGIPNCEGTGGIEVYQKQKSPKQFIRDHCSGALEFAPGTRFNYNNGDYIILGQIIENITGATFAKNLQDRILTPLKMENTGMLATRDIIPGLCPTYNIDEPTGIFYQDDPMYIENYFAAGAMYSTADDLLKFDRGIFTYKLLSEKTTNLMLTPFPELYGVALGFWVYDAPIGNSTLRVANRQGSIWGANADWLHVMNGDITIIILSNTNATVLPDLTMELVKAAINAKSTSVDPQGKK